MVAFALFVGLLAIAWVLNKWGRLIALRLLGIVIVLEQDATRRHSDWPERVDYEGD